MIIRVRSKEGNHRFDLQPTDDIQVLVQKILEVCKEADPSTLALSNQPRGGERSVVGMKGTLKQLGLSHGDLVFASYKDKTSSSRLEGPTISSPLSPEPSASGGPSFSNGGPSRSTGGKKPSAWQAVVEEPVDQELEKDQGKIPRPRDTKFCRHGDKSMCDYCMPLEPYDPVHHQENNIKHLSFQAYLRKINAATNKPGTGASYIPPLQEPDYRVTVPCPSGTHAPFPGGICSKCQPSAITLQLQQYRMVDHVEFTSPTLIENLLAYWRATGCQRFGYMLGRYERYEQVPLGVKAVVEAIHEIPQEGNPDGIVLGLPWEDEGRVEQLAEMCGLKVVGMVYTDLDPEVDEQGRPAPGGKVICKRHQDSFFLSSLEAIFSASEQRKRPNPSKYSPSGRFGSKFVTCVVTGDTDGSISVNAYQVSEQAVGMVEAGMIEASVDPGTVRLKEEDRDGGKEGGARYVPDVFYRYKNSYGIDVKENAKPCFPVDYLLVSLTHGFRATANPLFRATKPFPSANRPGFQDQSMEVVLARIAPLLKKLPAPGSGLSSSSSNKGKAKAQSVAEEEEAVSEALRVLSDWDMLVFLDSSGLFDKPDIAKLATLATARDSTVAHAALSTLLQTGAWQTLAMIAQEPAAPDPSRNYPSAGDHPIGADGFPDIPPEAFDTPMADATAGGGVGAAGGDSGEVSCPHCTFANPAGSTDCMICGLPMSG